MAKEVPSPAPKNTPGETEIYPLRPASSDLARSEERYKLLVETIFDYAIFHLDPEGYILTSNKGAQRIQGYSPEEIVGKHFSIFYTQDDIERRHPEHELEIAIRDGKFEEEGWRIRKDGSRFWTNVVITRLQDANGKFLGFAKITRDLTEKKAAEERLRMSEERFRLLVSAVKDYAIFMLDPEGRVATWNEGARSLKGYEAEEIIGQHFSKFYPDEDNRTKKPEWELEEATLTGRFEDEGWRIRKDGTRFWANVVITAVRNEKGGLIGFSKVTRDITDRRRLEEKLRRTNEELDHRVQERTAQLEQAVRARDEFMSIISHELRTPVTSLKLQVQTAMRQLNRKDVQTFNERAVKFVNGAGRQLDRLAKLIDDMLDVSRISIDRMRMDMEPIDLGEVVRDTVERFEDQCKASGCSITVSKGDPVRVRGDRARLEQVFSNLLINAIKYGGAKPIQVTISRAGSKALVSIKDQGIGIASEDQNRIFERFERAVSANSISGMGLGLFISRKIVESHQGRISVQSELARGSTFTVSLPALD